ncbi:MAG TPA: PEP-CTERM sorting domain-containing protein [Edaphobacter sp.]|nr:PEP-CTERM sorting domain-containing protein [Edaphobacter sp.]
MRFSKVFSLLLLAAASFIARADTFYITGAGVSGQEGATFSIPSPSTPDLLSGNSFSFSNVPLTVLYGFTPYPPAGTVIPATVSFEDLGDSRYFYVNSALDPNMGGEYLLDSPFFTVANGQISFIPGQYGFIGLGTSFSMSIDPDQSDSPVPEPATIALVATGALYLLVDLRRRRLAAHV